MSDDFVITQSQSGWSRIHECVWFTGHEELKWWWCTVYLDEEEEPGVEMKKYGVQVAMES